VSASECRSCGAEVIFVRSAATGRRMILDVEPTQGGNVALDDAGQAAYVLSGSVLERAQDTQEPLYTSHFATCPQANQWRGRRRR
jgi:hypothetical protein